MVDIGSVFPLESGTGSSKAGIECFPVSHIVSLDGKIRKRSKLQTGLHTMQVDKTWLLRRTIEFWMN